ncbi:(Fe-S)-binding protein [Zoogloea sp.]|uniref:(Fe-S)-binding protein n=1 Tax=Zoogloea sp. TaxID=49181 RepID=UPI00260111AB|nr:(Fe-S)-binding protein [Zoogloea sp.]
MSKAPEAAGAGHAARSYPPRPAAVYFYGTCLVDMFVPEAGMDAIALLEREGIRVIFPDNQTCCGQPAYTSGFPDEARQVVESQLDLFPEDYPIVVPSGSCAGMIRWHWEKVVAGDPASRPGRAPSPSALSSSPSFWCTCWISSAPTRALRLPWPCTPPARPAARWAPCWWAASCSPAWAT